MGKSFSKANSSQHLIKWAIFFGIAFLMFLCFFFLNTTPQNKVDSKKPFFSNICEIASDGEYVYTLDNTFNTICKYKVSGDFVLCIRFSSFGENYIFCDSPRSVCRYDLRQECMYVYDTAGNESEKLSIGRDELITAGTISYSHKTEQKVGTTIYSFHSHLLTNSIVEVNDGSKVSRFAVEGVFNHIVLCLLIITFAVCVIMAVLNLFKFLFANCNSKLQSFSKQ